MADKLLAGASIATTGVMTLHNRLYLNPLEGATFSTNTTSVTVTRGAGNAYVDVVTVVTPTNGALTLDSIETQSYVGDVNNSQFTGVTQ